MAYRITLTAGERKALDWVGGRDWTGYDLYHCLWVQSTQEPEMDWDDPGEMTCIVPEHVAWKIRDMWEDNGEIIPHLADEFASKLLNFIMNIV